MVRQNKRSKVPGKVEGPSVGAYATPNGVVVRVVNGKAPTLPRFTAKASSEDVSDIAAAARLVAARIEKYAKAPIAVSVDV